MATTITEIKNLTNATVYTAADLTKFTVAQTGTKFTVTGANLTPLPGFAQDNDNIQVTWTDGTNTHRAIGGQYKATDNAITISNLIDVSQYGVDLTGALEIGPQGGAIKLSVKIGNMNPQHAWIIDFSDKSNGHTGSNIKLNALIDWIKGVSNDKTTPTLPKVKTDPNAPEKDPGDFTIVFKNFYYNTQTNTFDFWIESEQNESISFLDGKLKITQLGFRVTNAPIVDDPKLIGQ